MAEEETETMKKENWRQTNPSNKMSSNVVKIAQYLQEFWKFCQVPGRDTVKRLSCHNSTTATSYTLKPCRPERQRNQSELAAVLSPFLHKYRFWEWCKVRQLDRKREVRVAAGSVWWRQTADRLDCISWIPGTLLYSPPLYMFVLQLFCWGCTTVKLHHLVSHSLDFILIL